MKNRYVNFLVNCTLGLSTILFSSIYAQCVAPTPTASGATISCGTSTTLTASGANTYNWFSNPQGSQLVGTGATFTTPVLSNNTTFYVQSTAGVANTILNFNNCGATGETGPTLAQMNAAYAGTSLAGLVTSTVQGIQEWVVPTTGTYTITAAGAKGGDANNAIGGSGRSITITTTLTQGHVIKILVGQQGGNLNFTTGWSGGGGGGTFLFNQTTNQLILAAGGGGGAAQGSPSYPYTLNGVDASAYNNTSGSNGTASAGSWCQGGNGGTNGSGGGGIGGSGGAGWTSNGTAGYYGMPGQMFSTGGLGGVNYSACGNWNSSSNGGFGGGAGAGMCSNYEANGGGGGGYSGGGGGACRVGAGGGGGCFYTGTFVSESLNAGHGLVTISYSGNACASQLVPVTVNIIPTPAPTANGTTINCGQTASLNASGGNNFVWYSDAAGTQQVGTGAVFTTPSLNNSTTYYVGALVGAANTTYHFTNCGNMGQNGPTLAQMNAAYAGTNLAGLVTSTVQGIQEWTVPSTGTYTITAAGAKGGDANNATGGSGRSITITTTLTQGHVIKLLVGQQGGTLAFSTGWAGGGGGGSFVYNQTTNQLILAAGGGGGAGKGDPNQYNFTINGGDGSFYNNTSGGTGINCPQSWCSAGSGGSNGAGGFAGGSPNNQGGAAGAGWNSQGTTGTYGGAIGQTFNQGGVGGVNQSACGNWTSSNNGGFGGGGGAGMCSNYEALGGGGGGYSGGGGAGCRVGAGGGGGSYYTGTFISEYLNNGHGLIDISYSGASCISQLVPVTVSVVLPASPTANGTTINCGQTASLVASGGNIYTWFSDAAGSQQVGTGSNFTTPILSSSTTYYVGSSATQIGGNQTFSYTGGVQTFTAPVTGTYTLEAWGAQGGNDPTSPNSVFGGRGGYAKGDVTLTAGTTLQIYVGEQGIGCMNSSWKSTGGGGATDFRLTGGNWNDNASLLSRILVAGGGGGRHGSNYEGIAYVGNDGGGASAPNFTANGVNVFGSTQNGGGSSNNTNVPGSFGFANPTQYSNSCSVGGWNGGARGSDNWANGGGGGGWFGGVSSWPTGSGGSGYAYTAASWTPAGYTPTAAYQLTNTQLTSGNTVMPNPIGGNMTGNSGNGFAKISWSGAGCISPLVPVTVTVTPPASPSATPATINCGQTATLSAAGGGGNSYTWYSDAAGTNVVGNGANFTTPALAANTTYYVASTSGLAPGLNYTFTPSGASGRYGPTQGQVNNAYAGTNLANQVTVNTQGIQEWVVPQAGTYQIQVNGAQGGGNGGLGARMQGEFNLTAGQKLFIAVGQQGNGPNDGGACGGGGGTFVATGNATYTTSTPLIVAGGGGGQSPQVGQPGLTTSNGGQGEGCQPGGTNGNGGADASNCGSGAGGAGGFYTNGASGGNYGNQYGSGFISGAAIGGSSSSGSREGGFGGGAGTHNNNTGGGAGGGYSGGSASYHGSNYEGGGGGSFNSGNNPVNTQGINAGNGSVIITPLAAPCVSALVPVTVTVNPIPAPTASNITINCGQSATINAVGNGTIYWYSDAAGTNSLGTGANYTTPQLSATTTYYMSGGTGQCALVNNPVTVTVIPPASPSATPATINCGQTATLSAAGGGGNSYTWYSDAAGTNVVGNGANFTTPALAANTTYYVASTSGLAPGLNYTFTPSGASGRYGPTQGQVNNAYAGTNLANQVTVNTQGIQEWVVPQAGTYQIQVNGAQGGGNGGLGARMQGEFNLTAGQKLFIAVGQQGNGPNDWGACGGGGGTFVATGNATYTTSTPLIVAGGGGGQSPQVGQPGLTTSNGGQGEGCQPGGTNGNGGADASNCGSGAGGAGGFYTNGASGGNYGNQYGSGFISGAAIGGSSSSGSREGGFGGGAGTHNNNTGGGAGGGYSGGSASYHGSNYEGGGGGSFNSGNNPVNTQGINAGNGSVIITPLAAPCVSALVPVTVTVNPIPAPTASNITINCGQSATLNAVGNGTIYWYSDAAGTNSLGTGATYTTPQLGSTTTYYVSSASGICGVNNNPVTVTVNAPASPTAANATISCGQTVTLSAIGGGGNTYTWYSDAALSVQVGTGASLTTPALTGTTTYYVTSSSGVVNGNVFTFTNCSATGQYGPTQGQVNNAYANTNLAGNVTSNNGIQVWTVPATGSYRIEAFGAQGGGNNQFGRGAQIRGDFNLTAGQQLQILVGQQGGYFQSGSGGGGSFVVTSANVPLLIAGGGGGQYDQNSQLFNAHAVVGNNGQASGCTSGGTNGAGGNGCNNSGASGGGGFNTNGGSGSYGTGGLSFLNGGNGGNQSSQAACIGGFGGGGGTHGNTGGGGGGGGYSGGAGGYHSGNNGSGGGGGSYNTGTNPVNVGGVNNGHGYVVITSLTPPCASNAVPVTVTVNPIPAPIVAGNISFCGQNSITTTLTASGSPNDYTWWTNANATGQLATGAVFNTPVINNTTTYYVQSTTPQGGSQTFNYTGSAQSFTAPVSGTYTLEAWGAQGGNDLSAPNSVFGGRGGYSKGDVYLAAGTTINIYVGGQGSGCNASNWKSTGGGGATDFRLIGGTWNDNAGLYSRILVAGGGGGRHGNNYENMAYVGNDGGGLSSPNINACGYNVTGATQNSGGSSPYGAGVAVGSFGYANANTMSNVCSVGGWNGGAAGADNWANGGAGGGWYGGCTSWCTSTGGSGYVYTSSSYVPPGYTPSAAYQMTNAQLIAGNTVMPNPNGGTMTGNSGHGIAKITWTGTGCVSSLTPVTVTVGQAPNVSAGNNQTVCTGTAITLNGSGAATYSWDNGVNDGVSFTPAATQTYTVIGTNANGCTDTAQVTVTVNALPTVSAGQNQTVCSGTAITLNGSGAATYSWDNGVNDGVSFTPAATQTYTVIGTNANGCTDTAQVTVTVNALPSVSAGQNQTVCSGTSVTLNGSGANSYTWNNGVNNGVAFTPAATQTYTVTGTNANGCSNTAQVTVTVNALPSVSAGQNQTVCSGTSVTLNGSGANSYTWNNGVNNGVAFTPAATQTYTVTGTNANGCSNTAQVTVTVNALPSVSAGQNQTVCSGTSVTLNGSGASTYTWNNGVSNGVAFTPAATQTYTVTGTNANGCSNTAQVTVTVNALPSVSAGQNQTVCAGTSVTLNGSGASTYTWNNGVNNGVAFTPAATQTYTVTGTNANGCSNTAQVTVTVNALPNVSAGQNQTVCAGTAVTLNGSGANTYTWNNGVSNGVAFTPAATQTYTVTGTNANGCSNTAQVTVTVNALPTVSAGQNQTVCAGTSVTLNGSGASTYTWNNGVSNGVAFTPAATQTYTVTGTNANGCSNTAQVTVTVNALPSVSAGQNQTVCAGTSVTLNGSGASTYTWNNGVSNGVAFTPAATQTYTVTGTNANGCSNTAQVTVTVNALPSVSAGPDTTVCDSDFPVTISANGNPNLSYTWNNGSNTQQTIISAAGTYTVTVTDGFGCSASDDIIVINEPCSGLEEGNFYFNLYPNPFDQFITLKSSQNISANIEIYSAEGRLISNTHMDGVEKIIVLENLARGSYTVRISAANAQRIFTIIKQ